MKILVVDDHEIARDGIKLQLKDLSQNLELDEAGSCAEAAELARNRVYDLVLLDLNLPDTDSLETLLTFRSLAPSAPVVVLSGAGNSQLVRSAIESGAMGFIPKRASRSEMVAALKKILSGGIYLPDLVLTSSAVDDSAKERARMMAHLTYRQLQVLRRAIEGKSNKVIADDLRLSTHTVKAHLSAAMRVLGVSNRTEAVFKTAQLGLHLS
jgi:DNA-binding NarL/FixJ family response regulator